MKVLVIANNSFSKTGNNGKTLCSIFSNFRSEDMAQLYFGTNENPDEEFCDNYYRVTELDVLKSLLNLSFRTSNTHRGLISSIKDGAQKEAWWFRTLKRFDKKLSLGRELLWRSNTWDTKELNGWIKQFNPDVIFALLGSNVYVHKIAIKLADRYNLPLFTYFTDDYVINSTAKGLIEKMHYRSLCRQYEKTMAKTHKAYVIGSKMQTDYSEMYSRSFGILGNCIDIDKYSHLHPRAICREEPIVISYMGALHSNRWRSIAELGDIIKEINLKYGYKIKIKVFSMARPEQRVLATFENSEVDYCGALDSSGVITQMENSHYLLHVESFDATNRTYVKYSISTKISEYLSSSRGVMAYGPHEVASMQLLIDNGFGCCMTDLDSKEDIERKICNSIENYNNYDHKTSREFVLTNYNKDIVSSRLICDMQEAMK